MIHHLTSKIALALYLLAFVAVCVWGFLIFKDRDGKVASRSRGEIFQNESATPIVSTNDLTNNDSSNNKTNDQTTTNETPVANNDATSNPAEKKSEPISSNPEIIGQKLANITPEHYDTACKAFSADLKLFEYCQQSCGISPVKNVSNCDGEKGIRKDYCLKDLAINKKDSSQCEKVNDANIQRACKSRIAQDAIENLR